MPVCRLAGRARRLQMCSEYKQAQEKLPFRWFDTFLSFIATSFPAAAPLLSADRGGGALSTGQ